MSNSVITDERAEILANYLQANENRACDLLQLSAEDAANQINSAGFDFTADEIRSFGKQFQTATYKIHADDILDEDELSKVAGGASWFPPYEACRAAWNLGQCIGAGIVKKMGRTPNYTWWP